MCEHSVNSAVGLDAFKKKDIVCNAIMWIFLKFIVNVSEVLDLGGPIQLCEDVTCN